MARRPWTWPGRRPGWSGSPAIAEGPAHVSKLIETRAAGRSAGVLHHVHQYPGGGIADVAPLAEYRHPVPRARRRGDRRRPYRQGYGPAIAAGPDTLRYRIWHIPARLARHPTPETGAQHTQ